MAGAYDFASTFAGMKDPGAAFMEGLKNAAGMEQLQLQRQQQRAQMASSQQLSADLQALAANPSTEGIASMSIKYPQLSEHLKKAHEMVGADQLQSRIAASIPIYAAATSGRHDLAAKQLRDRATALENAGNKAEADKTRAFADKFEQDPGAATAEAGLSLSAAMGPDKFAATFGQLGSERRADAKLPDELVKGKADASSAMSDAAIKGVAAGNARTKTALDNQTAQEAIRTAQLKRDLDTLDVQIKQANSETERGRLVLERDKLNAELAKTQTVQGQGAQDAMGSLTQALGTVGAIEQHPGLSSGVGFGSDFKAWFAGTDARDVRALVDTLKSQQFLANVATLKGAGALSDAEGARLERATASLDAAQSEKQFRNQLGVIRQSLQKAQSTLVARGQLPQQGEAFVMKHPVYGNVTEGSINNLMRQYPGSTREQVLDFLKQSGGK